MCEAISVADVRAWAKELDSVVDILAPLFSRSEPRRHCADYIRALLGDAERKNSWQAAEFAGHSSPHAFQHLLGRARWDHDAARDLLADYAFDHFLSPESVLVFDESGFLKKGLFSAGVQRQYSGTAGRIENCQVGVFAALVGPKGRVLIDRRLYLPQSWLDDDQRCEKAGIPDSAVMRTKAEIAQDMLEALDRRGHRAAWVTADEIYGQCGEFRDALTTRRQAYVLAVPKSQHWYGGGGGVKAEAVADGIETSGWEVISVGDGAKGPREYEWARVAASEADEKGWREWLLVRLDLPKVCGVEVNGVDSE